MDEHPQKGKEKIPSDESAKNQKVDMKNRQRIIPTAEIIAEELEKLEKDN